MIERLAGTPGRVRQLLAGICEEELISSQLAVRGSQLSWLYRMLRTANREPRTNRQPLAELEGVGAITLRQLVERWLEHDAGHLADIEALLAGRAARTTADAA